jgi:hypothetical protein
MPYEDLIANVQRRVDNGQGSTIEQSRALLELLARYRAGLAEIRALAADVVLQFGTVTFRIRCREQQHHLLLRTAALITAQKLPTPRSPPKPPPLSSQPMGGSRRKRSAEEGSLIVDEYISRVLVSPVAVMVDWVLALVAAIPSDPSQHDAKCR